MFERFDREFRDQPRQGGSARVARRAGEVGVVSLVTFESYDKKMTRLSGRDPARSSIREKALSITTPSHQHQLARTS